MTGLQRPQAQSLLGKFLFSGWGAHEKAVKVLSGGERRRLALAVVVASGANFLVLDEPTNHLDLESREALEAALEAFPGTMLLVSHDRALIDAVAERTLAIEHGRLNAYDGGWADYVRVREEAAAAATVPSAPPVEKRPQRPPVADAEAVDPADRARPDRGRDRDGRGSASPTLERRLAEDWTNIETIAEHRRARDELQALLTRWEALFERSQA